MKFFWFTGNLMAGSLDIAMGMLFASLLAPLWGFHGELWGIPVLVWLLPVGSYFAFFPDQDLFWHILRGKKVYFDHHQTPLHRPVLMLTLVPLLMYVFFGTFFGVLAFVGIAWHYIHDTHFTGDDGIAWLWPLSRMYWSFTGRTDPKNVILEPDYYKRWLNAEWFTVAEVFFAVLISTFAIWLTTGLVIIPLILACLEVAALGIVWRMWTNLQE